MLSVVIPAHNEEKCLRETVEQLVACLEANNIVHEIVIVDDSSTDNTREVATALSQRIGSVRLVIHEPPNGFGLAVRRGLDSFTGDAVVILMADASDSPRDVVAFYHKLNEGYDCVFGSRFMKGSRIEGYPVLKRVINRMANLFIRVLFGLRYNDVTNAFKMYKRSTIEGLRPFLSKHFNLTVELPLKAITRGYTYAVVPNSWRTRKVGVSKLRLKEMGSRYLFIVLYCLIEKWLSVGDYRKQRT